MSEWALQLWAISTPGQWMGEIKVSSIFNIIVIYVTLNKQTSE
jgi:hypothetical protein